MSDLILPTEEQAERAARLLNEAFQPCYEPLLRSEARKFLFLLLNKDKILGEPDVTYPEVEPSPIALTEDHIPSLERAIRAEGYDIKVDTETGEVKLYREQGVTTLSLSEVPWNPSHFEGSQDARINELEGALRRVLLHPDVKFDTGAKALMHDLDCILNRRTRAKDEE